MIVSELEELLALLPGDMTVAVVSDGACRHITIVDKASRRRHNPETTAALEAAGLGPVVLLEPDLHPAHLVLRGGSDAPHWWQAFGDVVDYKLHGRWPRAAYEQDGDDG